MDFLTEKNGATLFSPADLVQLAEDIDYGCQMWNETAYAPIPNPLSYEVDRLKEARKSDERDHDKEVERLRGLVEEWKRECRRLEWRLEDARSQGFRD